MVEPCETESRETMDQVCDVLLRLAAEARSNPQALRDAPRTTPVRRLDEVAAARHPVVRYEFD
jgi:glycine dehydrogenase subunit 2